MKKVELLPIWDCQAGYGPVVLVARPALGTDFWCQLRKSGWSTGPPPKIHLYTLIPTLSELICVHQLIKPQNCEANWIDYVRLSYIRALFSLSKCMSCSSHLFFFHWTFTSSSLLCPFGKTKWGDMVVWLTGPQLYLVSSSNELHHYPLHFYSPVQKSPHFDDLFKPCSDANVYHLHRHLATDKQFTIRLSYCLSLSD